LAWRQGRLTLLVATEILDEYTRVARYDRIRRRIQLDGAQLDRALARFRSLGEIIELRSLIERVSADPDDDIYLACAVAGQADYIVSGDRHLLDLGNYRGIPVVTPAAFVALVGGPSAT
jgi:uncharacterized protein